MLNLFGQGSSLPGHLAPVGKQQPRWREVAIKAGSHVVDLYGLKPVGQHGFNGNVPFGVCHPNLLEHPHADIQTLLFQPVVNLVFAAWARLSSCRDSMRAWVWCRRARPDSSSLRSFSICARSSCNRFWSDSTSLRMLSSRPSMSSVLRDRLLFSPLSSVCAASPLCWSSAPNRAAAWLMRSSRWLIC